MELHEIYSISSLLKINLWMKLVSIDEVLYVSNPLSCFRGHLCSQTAKSTGKTNFRGQLETVLQTPVGMEGAISEQADHWESRTVFCGTKCGDGCTLSGERQPVVWEVAHSLAPDRNPRIGVCSCEIRELSNELWRLPMYNSRR